MSWLKKKKTGITTQDKKEVPGGLFVKFDTDPNYFVITGAGDIPIGIVNSNVAAGQPATQPRSRVWRILPVSSSTRIRTRRRSRPS